MKQNKIHNINKTGFKVPKNYFDNLEGIILSDIKLKEAVNDSGFKTPKGYFNTLEDSIIEKVLEKDSTKILSLFSKRNLVYISSIAAALLLLFNLPLIGNESNLESIDNETVENYILEDFDSYEIASLLIDDGDYNEYSFSELDFTDEALEDYILNHTSVDDLIIN